MDKNAQEDWNVFLGPRSLFRCRGKIPLGEGGSARMVDPCGLFHVSTPEDDLYATKVGRLFQITTPSSSSSPPSIGEDGREIKKVEVKLEPETTIDPKGSWSKITNNVVTVHYQREGEQVYVDQRRIPLFLVYALRNEKFAAVIMPMGGATVLFFANGKVVITGKVTVQGALFGLHMCRIKLGKIPQPVILKRKNEQGRYVKELRLCYLKTLLGFSRFAVQNIVGSGLLVKPGETVDLAALHKAYPETSWDPEIFPGLKFHLCRGNDVLPKGFKCTAHIFEGKIVIMAPKTAEEVKIAYDHFLELVKPFVVASSKEYKENRYKYRYNQMMGMYDRKIPTVAARASSKREKGSPDKSRKNLGSDVCNTDPPPPPPSPSFLHLKDVLIRENHDLFESVGIKPAVREPTSLPLPTSTVDETIPRGKKRKRSDAEPPLVAPQPTTSPSSSSSTKNTKKDSILNFDFLSYLTAEDIKSVQASLNIAKKMRYSTGSPTTTTTNTTPAGTSSIPPMIGARPLPTASMRVQSF